MKAFDLLAIRLGRPDFNLILSQHTGNRNFSDPGYATRFAPNLAATIAANVEMQYIRQSLCNVVFDADRNSPALIWEIEDKSREQLGVLLEHSTAAFFRLSRDVLNEPMNIRSLRFPHSPRFSESIYENFFQCPVSFNNVNGRMEMDPQQLYRNSPQYNAELQSAALKMYSTPNRLIAEGKRTATFCFLYMVIEMDKSPITIERIAKIIGKSDRTLRRQLVEEGYPFRDLLEQVRMQLWKLYQMENTRSLGKIAELLGYGELSAFSRSHKRWFGSAPTKFGENGGRSKD